MCTLPQNKACVIIKLRFNSARFGEFLNRTFVWKYMFGVGEKFRMELVREILNSVWNYHCIKKNSVWNKIYYIKFRME